MERKRIITLNVNMCSYNEAIERVLVHARDNVPSYACFANVHMTIEAHQNKNFATLVNDSSFSFTDGVPLVFSLKFLYGVKQDRIAGMDFMNSIIKECADNQLSVFLFGSTNVVLSVLRERLMKNFPQLKIAGLLSPPFRNFTNDDNENFIKIINESKANLVFVSLGCPKQESWMAAHYTKINAILLGVGGAFPVVAGITSRAPIVMQKFGLEWIYRLYQEPRRLFKRYLITNSMFIYLILREKILMVSFFRNSIV